MFGRWGLRTDPIISIVVECRLYSQEGGAVFQTAKRQEGWDSLAGKKRNKRFLSNNSRSIFIVVQIVAQMVALAWQDSFLQIRNNKRNSSEVIPDVLLGSWGTGWSTFYVSKWRNILVLSAIIVCSKLHSSPYGRDFFQEKLFKDK